MDIRHDGILRRLLIRVHRPSYVEGTRDQGMDRWRLERHGRRRESHRL